MLRDAELPPGVVNIITGDDAAGAALVAHPGVDKVAFTGSTEVGRAIAAEMAGTGKRLTLELGGKAANIVFDDAALDQVTEGIVNGIYFNGGQVCCAGSRLLVQETVADTVVGKLRRRMDTLRVGDPLDKNTDIGAINSQAQLNRIQELVASGVAEGAELYTPECVPTRAGLLPRPGAVHQCVHCPPHRPGGDFRAGTVGAHFPHRRGGGGQGQQHALWAVGRHLD